MWLPAGIRSCRIAHKGMVYFLAFTPDGGTLASGDDDTEVRLWDVASAQPGASFKEDWRRIAGRRHPGRILSVAFRPEGGAVVSFGSPYEVRRWDVESGQLEAILSLETEHMEYVESVAFSPDGKSLASTGYDNAVRLWDVEGRRLRTVLYGHWRRVLAVAFSPDGSLLASGNTALVSGCGTLAAVGTWRPPLEAARRQSLKWPSRRTAQAWPTPQGGVRSFCGRWPMPG